jgi:hypothetical protein
MINVESIILMITVISAAGERGVEIIKNLFDFKKLLPHDKTRTAVIQGINFAINVAITASIWENAVKELPIWLANPVGVVVIGMFACTGANGLHSLLGFVEAITINKKDLTKV